MGGVSRPPKPPPCSFHGAPPPGCSQAVPPSRSQPALWSDSSSCLLQLHPFFPQRFFFRSKCLECLDSILRACSLPTQTNAVVLLRLPRLLQPICSAKFCEKSVEISKLTVCMVYFSTLHFNLSVPLNLKCIPYW